jgi:hypothetical protein
MVGEVVVAGGGQARCDVAVDPRAAVAAGVAVVSVLNRDLLVTGGSRVLEGQAC